MLKNKFLLILIFIFPGLIIAENMTREAIEERIKPVGQVETTEEIKEKKTATPAAPRKAMTGQEVYDQYCVICHGSGVAGAPKKEDPEDWKPHLAEGGMAHLMESVQNGKNAMPTKGNCPNCSDAELEAAINYMLPKKK